ncbi:MAG: hypothetical protein GXN93_04430 [Candidatus Diapherotrites archaeon]|nr:hypothetical protein [Candidatus Diapherotrites archaeon]
MEEALGRLKDSLNRLQKGIYYLNTYLRESYEMAPALEALSQAYDDFVRVLEEYPDLNEVAEEFVRENDLLPTFKEMKARYEGIRTLLAKYEALIDSVDGHLERYRTYRYYLFKEDDSVARFVDIVFSNRGEVVIRPLILGEKGISEALQKLGGKQVSKVAFQFTGDRAADAADLFLREFPSAGFVVESGDIRMTWKPDVGVVRLDLPKDMIHEYDEQARRLNATVLAV